MIRFRVIDTIIKRNFTKTSGNLLTRRIGEKLVPVDKKARTIYANVNSSIIYDGTEPSKDRRIVYNWHQDDTTNPTDLIRLAWMNGVFSEISMDITLSDGGSAAHGINSDGNVSPQKIGPLTPFQLRQSGYFSNGVTYTWTLSNLDPDKTYTISSSASRNGSNELRQTTMTIGGTSQTYTTTQANGGGNPGEWAEITGISPDVNGQIVIDFTVATGIFGYVSGIVLTEE
jgi:hypothetical protein